MGVCILKEGWKMCRSKDCVHRLYIGERNNGLCICSNMNVGSGNVGSRKIKENLIKYYKIDLWYYDKIKMK